MRVVDGMGYDTKITDKYLETVHGNPTLEPDGQTGRALVEGLIVARAEIARLREELAERQEWIDRAVAACAKRRCSERDAEIARLRDENERLRNEADEG